MPVESVGGSSSGNGSGAALTDSQAQRLATLTAPVVNASLPTTAYLDTFSGATLLAGWTQATAGVATVSGGLISLTSAGSPTHYGSQVYRSESALDGLVVARFAAGTYTGKSPSVFARQQGDGGCYLAVIQNGSLFVYALEPSGLFGLIGGAHLAETPIAGYSLGATAFDLAISVKGSGPTLVEAELLNIDGTCARAIRLTNDHPPLQYPGRFGLMNFGAGTVQASDFRTAKYAVPPRRGLIIGTFGNSIMAGTGTSGGEATVSAQIGTAFASLTGLPVTMVNQGVAGAKTTDVIAGGMYHDAMLAAFSAAGVNVVTGFLDTNDSIDPAISPTQHATNMLSIANDCLAIGVQAVVLHRGPYYVSYNSGQYSPITYSKMAALGAALASICDGKRVLMGDTGTGEMAIAANTSYLVDGLHLNDIGAAVLGKILAYKTATALGIT